MQKQEKAAYSIAFKAISRCRFRRVDVNPDMDSCPGASWTTMDNSGEA